MMRKKIYIDDLVFYLGIFLIPFDNLFFAPSRGWATIAPFFFLLYIILNYRFLLRDIKKYAILSLFFVFMLFSSLINFMFYNVDISELINSVMTLFLGVSFYFSLKIYCIDKEKSVSTFIKILVGAYAISLVYGLLYLTEIPFIRSTMALLEKRSDVRLHFTFTEPSFISMHLFGVILPLVIIFKKEKPARVLAIVGVLILLTSFVFSNSARLILDTVIIGFIIGLYCLFKSKKSWPKVAFICCVMVAAFLLFNFGLSILGERINTVLQKGIYFDNSLSARWFRVNAIIKGIQQNPISMFFGYGISNAHIPFNAGYNAAFFEYANNYFVEINGLRGTLTSQFYCMPIRLIAEYGAIFTLLVYIAAFDRKNIALYIIICYLGLQFDSYAFWSIWLYFFAKTYEKRVRHVESIEEVAVDNESISNCNSLQL